MKLSGRIDLGLYYSYTAITIPIKNEDRQEAIGWLKNVDLKADDEITIEVKKKRKKRSLNANAYFWVLVNKLAEKQRIPVSEVYRRLVDENGVFTVLMVREDVKPAFEKLWTAGKDSSGWFVKDAGNGVVHAYCGTSVYDKDQMSRIIDAAVFDCKQQNIETMTPDELAHLKATWGE